jgi:hypothetical protein
VAAASRARLVNRIILLPFLTRPVRMLAPLCPPAPSRTRATDEPQSPRHQLSAHTLIT